MAVAEDDANYAEDDVNYMEEVKEEEDTGDVIEGGG